VITGVSATLGIFSALLLVRGILFYPAVSRNRLISQNASALSYQHQERGGSFQTLIKTRFPITRGAMRMLKNQREPASL
ncbi:Tar ligand binding domain-containing protein, partial [Salmonella enterica]|uniref:Tar ligand binding domain-containing protein n=1 Tax=Salmonella enterica TaxID=28901 RepID=UPI00093A8980